MEVARVHARIHHVGLGGPIFGSFSNFRFRVRSGPGDPIPDDEFCKWLVELRGVNLLSSKQYRGVVDEPETGGTFFLVPFSEKFQI